MGIVRPIRHNFHIKVPSHRVRPAQRLRNGWPKTWLGGGWLRSEQRCSGAGGIATLRSDIRGPTRTVLHLAMGMGRKAAVGAGGAGGTGDQGTYKGTPVGQLTGREL